MKHPVETYTAQLARLPAEGEHVIAAHDAATIIVYQAYRRDIAEYAVGHQRFGGPWSFNRMSWIKPGYLWMMYRAGWAQKPDQEHILAIRLPRPAFDSLVAAAVVSSFHPQVHRTEAEWREQLANSEVRVQWDPDHDPYGQRVKRRAIQLGLRGETLRKFAQDWPVSIEDITPDVHAGHRHLQTHGPRELPVPVERVYGVGGSVYTT